MTYFTFDMFGKSSKEYLAYNLDVTGDNLYLNT